MSQQGGDSAEVAEELAQSFRTRQQEPSEFIRQEVEDEEVMEELVKNQRIDTIDGESGLGDFRKAIIKSDLATPDVKRVASYRGREPQDDVLVPESVERNAKVAIETNKPVVLYGPTGTGKTVFAKQLAYETCLDYHLHTADPEWTTSKIIGGLRPASGRGGFSYEKSPGFISEAVQQAQELDINVGVIFDEITRADISKVFGPLYTAIENRNQVIFTTDDNEEIRLDERVKLICTMNMSDRTVNELDNAITRRFAMIKLDKYEASQRKELYRRWAGDELSRLTGIDVERLRELFEQDHQGINEGETSETGQSIMRFGPMHYSDVADFLRQACQSGGQYEDDVETAVGAAFATYIVPRLLNSTSYPYIDNIIQHYQALDGRFDYDLTPAITLAQEERDSQRRQTGIDAYE